MNTIKKTLIFALIILCANSCKNNINSQIEEDNPTPGSRNYTWKTDTLNLDGWDNLERLWGSSAEDVWAAGTGGLFHYDGINWDEYKGMRWNLKCLYGFASNDIWTMASGNYNGVNIFHYDGNKWNNLGLFTNQTTNGFLSVYDIWGNSSANVYAVGGFFHEISGNAKAIIMHYDGVNWSFMNIPYLNLQLIEIRQDTKQTGKYYIWGIQDIWDTTKTIPVYQSSVYKIFEFDGKNLLEIYSSPSSYRNITSLNGKVYFVDREKLWAFANNEFSIKVDISQNEYTVDNIKGRTTKDLFVYSRKKNSLGSKKYITHYNGTDLLQIFSGDYISHFEIIGNDIFILSLENRWLVTRGTQNIN